MQTTRLLVKDPDLDIEANQGRIVSACSSRIAPSPVISRWHTLPAKKDESTMEKCRALPISFAS